MLSNIKNKIQITFIEAMVICATFCCLLLLLLPIFSRFTNGPYAYTVTQNEKTYQGYSVHNNFINKYDTSIIIENENRSIILDPKNGPIDIKRVKQ